MLSLFQDISSYWRIHSHVGSKLLEEKCILCVMYHLQSSQKTARPILVFALWLKAWTSCDQMTQLLLIKKCNQGNFIFQHGRDMLSHTREEGDNRTQGIGTLEEKFSEYFYSCFPHIFQRAIAQVGLKLELFMVGCFCCIIQQS